MKPLALLVSPVTPSYNGPGVNQRAALHVTALAKYYQLHLVILPLYADNVVLNIPEDIQELCRSTSVIQPVSKAVQLPDSIPFALPLNELWRPDARIVLPSETENLLSPEFALGQEFDVALFFRTSTGEISNELLTMIKVSPRRIAVDFDDIESSYLQRQRKQERERNGLQYDLMLKIKQIRQSRLEDSLLNQFDIVSICSEKDRISLKARNKAASIVVLPNCIIPPSFTPSQENEIFNILFVGTLSYAPNEDGILYFCNEVLPLLRQSASRDFEVCVVGFNPPQKVIKLDEIPEITVLGGVDDVGDYYTKTDLVIAPIRFGAGTRIKILEAMSYAKPVVSTTLGAEGINADNGTSILIGDTPQEFADACQKAMDKPAIARELGERGLKFVTSEFSIERCYAELLSNLDEKKSASNISDLS